MLRAFLSRMPQEGPPTHLDMLKFAAIIAMTLDLIGAFLLPESDGLRAVGRLFMPLWFIAVGYEAGKGNVPQESPVYAATLWLLALNLLFKGNVFPFALPLAIVFCWKLLAVKRFHKAIDTYPLVAFAVLAVLAFPALYLVEYGTLSLIFALIGYWIAAGNDSASVRIVALVAAAFYGTVQVMYFAFGPGWEWFVYLSVAAVTLFSLELKDRPWNWLLARAEAVPAILLLTRHILYYYVALSTVLRIANHFLYPSDSAWHFSFF